MRIELKLLSFRAGYSRTPGPIKGRGAPAMKQRE